MNGARPVARFDDCSPGGRALVLARPRAILETRRVDEVPTVLAEIEAAVAGGRYAAGYLAYEAAAAFGLPVRGPGPAPGPPLVWFALFDAVSEEPAVQLDGARGDYVSGDWRLDTSVADYERGVAAVRDAIARGDTYECNLTVRLHGEVQGNLHDFYHDLALAQRGAYSCLFDLGDYVVASASPELFLEWRGTTLTTRPMKGTRARGRTPDEDLERARALRADEKERAENLMIVDLMRNDLGRLARYGSVEVPELFRLERYETVWQLTSTVTAQVDRSVSLLTVLGALFPSGSVTGAPKHAAMSLIAGLEDSPRGVYCGALGLLAPPGSPLRARFSVGIRTVVVERERAAATYGAGGAITWGSVASAEFEEMLAKTAILSERPSEFSLLETLGFSPGEGLRHAGRHLARLRASAAYFGFAFDEENARRRLEASVREAAEERRVRLVLSRSGSVEVTTAPVEERRGPLRLVVDTEPVDSAAVWRYHKTTRRQIYEARGARHPEADDVILVNERGELTETTIANLLVFLDGYWFTPPLASGCLPGVGRALALEQGRCYERVLGLRDLEIADAVATVSSLRGWRSATLLADPALIA